MPLRGVDNARQLAEHIRAANTPGALFLDLKEETNRLVSGYRHESLRLTALGLLAITVVLWWGLKNIAAVVRVLSPVLIAVVLTVALLTLLGERLSLFHLVSLLLVIGIGLNYALFFNRDVSDAIDARRTLLSLTICSLATLSAFGTLAFSHTPVLHAIGLTVCLGCMCSLLLSPMLAKRQVRS
jgi:predicted exporter